MENTMVKDNFLQQVLDLMNKRMDGLEKKVDDNTSLTQQALTEVQATNGKVADQEKLLQTFKTALGKVERKSGKKIDLSPNVLYLIALGSIILLLIIASILHVDLGGLLK